MKSRACKKENTCPPKQIAGCDHRPELFVEKAEKPLKIIDFVGSKVTQEFDILAKMLAIDVPNNGKPPSWSCGLSLLGASYCV
jgi:hypothetical protein